MAGLLRGLRQQLSQMVSPATRRDLAELASREIGRQVQLGFDLKEDPYGVPWKPRKRPGPGSLMDKTGALRDGIFVDATPKSVQVRVTGPAKRYAPFHQSGTSKLPRRRFMPDGSEIPERWKKSLGTLSDSYFDQKWKR